MIDAPELSPTLLEKYQILGEISRGGMGVVYKALHREMGKAVAIKVILSQLPNTEDVQRFEREALTLGQLNHPNIVRVFEFSGFSHQSHAYMVMEFVEGVTFHSWVKERVRKSGTAVALEESAPILETLASALSYCHSKGIAHRDLKPVNVIIEKGSTRPVLLDFGLVKADAKRLAPGLVEIGSPLTATGEILGTPAFMAPEQIDPNGRFGPLGFPCDVWGFGGLLYFAVTGRPPHQGSGLIEIFGNIIDTEVSPPSVFEPQVPDWAEQLCIACLRRDSLSRIDIQSVSELIRTRHPTLEESPKTSIKGPLFVLFAVMVALLLTAVGILKSEPVTPELSFSRDIAVSTRKSEVLVSGTVSKATHIQFQIKIKGKAKKQKINVEGKQRFEVTLPLGQAEGEHFISARAIRGKTFSALKQWTIKVDRTPPSVTYKFPKPCFESPITINCKADEEVAYFKINGKKVACDNQGNIELALPIGKHTLKFEVADVLGNISAPRNLVIRRDSLLVVTQTPERHHRFFSMADVPVYKDLREAVKNAPKNAKIAIFPGTYEAALDLKRPITLEGIGERDSVHLTSSTSFCVLGISETRFVLRNLKIDSPFSLSMKKQKGNEAIKATLDKVSALMINRSVGLIDKCHFTRLHNGVGAGSLYADSAGTDVGFITVRDCVFDHCEETALSAQAGVRLVVENSRFLKNGTVMGGNGVYANSCGLSVTNCYFEANSTGLLTRASWDAKVSGCRFLKNRRAYSGLAESRLKFEKTRFEQNGVESLAQVHIDNSDLSFKNCEFLKGVRSGLTLFNGGRVRLENCSFTGHPGTAARFDPRLGSRPIKVEMRGCTFDNEGARGNRTGVELFVAPGEHPLGSLSIKNCVFKHSQSSLILPDRSRLKYRPIPGSKKLRIIEFPRK